MVDIILRQTSSRESCQFFLDNMPKSNNEPRKMYEKSAHSLYAIHHYLPFIDNAAAIEKISQDIPQL